MPIAADSSLIHFSRAVMATTFEALFPWGTPNAHDAAEDALTLIDRLEAQLTVYRDTSEVSRLNRLAAKAPVPVEAGLFQLLELAIRLGTKTCGAFDITAGPLTKAWGFHRRQGRVPSDEELTAAMATIGQHHLQLDPVRRAVRFAKPGVEINLGSIGKGYALDRVAERLRERWRMPAFLLNGGTSSVLAVGEWPVGIRHPTEPRRLGTLRLRDRALASSGTTHQHFTYNGKAYGHLLDPRSGQPAEGVELASAIARTAADADALSTAFFVLGPTGTREYCAAHPEVSAVLLTDAGLETVNLAREDWADAGPEDWYSEASRWDDA